MGNLEVGDTFKVSIKHNGSIGFGYDLIEDQDEDYLEISEPVLKYNQGENGDGPILLGAETIYEYTVKVSEAGEGNITFSPWMRAGLD